MTQPVTLSSDPNLTDAKGVQESQEESVGTEETKDLPEGAKNWQHALQQKAELLQKKEREAEELRRLLKEKEDAEKQQRLSQMSEAERYRIQAEDAMRELGELKVKTAVSKMLEGRNIPSGIKEIIERSPWVIPPVADELGDVSSRTWDEVEGSVNRHLPNYINSLEVRKEEPQNAKEEESAPRVIDSERSVDPSVVRNHVYTREEIARLGDDYEKHRDKILKQMAASGGKI